MKYPQLVSTRAVSAISDWLVTQLEQLGVDASSVYSRLLLSLLHTPLQINALDLAEISDNKILQLVRNKSNFGKGGAAYRRFSAADTEALKRLAAIDSLLEAVPSDQQLSKIESLVDELSLKLREIEEQNGLEDSVFEIGQSDDSNLCNSKVEPNDKKSEVSDDPARRYFNAFPALSDQSQTEYSHKKTSSWPHVSNIDSSSSSSNSNINSFGSYQPPNLYSSTGGGSGSGSASGSGSSASGSGATAIATKKKTKRRRVTNSMTMASNWSNTSQMDGKSSAQPPMQMQMQSSKVSSSSGGGKGGVSGVGSGARNANQTKSNQRKKPADMWDTDFDGAWEMGRDLIREFVLKQNNRNRSISECDSTVAALAASSSMASAALQSPMKDGDVIIESAMDLPPGHGKDGIERRKCTNDEDEENLMRVAAAATTALFGKNFDMNLYAPFNLCDSETVSSSCSRITDSSGQLLMVNDKAMQRSEGYSTPDTLASWNEIETAVTPMQYATMDGSNAKLGYQIAIDSGSDCVDSGCDENTCLAAFEAKFDHNVEALWNDCKSIDDPKSGSGTMSLMMDGQHSFWLDYDKQTTNQNTTANVDQFKQFFQANPAAITSYAMHGGLSGADLNRGGFATVTAAAAKLAAVASSQANANAKLSSTAVPPVPSIGGMNLTSTIWTDTPNNNEDDVSFYANARLWEMNQSKSMGRKFNFYSNESAAKNASVGGGSGNNHNNNTNIAPAAASAAGAVPSNTFEIGNYETANFSKWSDTELPVLSLQNGGGAGDVVDHCPLNVNENEEKIRKNLFGNSYFYNYQSSQRATGNNSTNCGLTATSMENAENAFGRAKNVQTRKITLVNHSSGSCFKEVEPLSFEAKQELYSMNNARKLQTIDSLDSEDLLTSERTRFRPIKQTYADGYAFDISNKLDHINYERSKSGLLYHNSEVYREYYLYDDEGNGGGSRCDDDDGATSTAEFTLKYCIRQNDKSCQTDDSVQQAVIAQRRSQQDNWLDVTRMRSASSLSSGANSCISSSMARNHPRSAYFEAAENNSTTTTTSTSTLDKLMDVSQDGWCLDENRQCCNNNNNNNVNVNNNNNNNNSVRALWDTYCATCSMDVVSMPANRRLKDELSADGDEIMKDLKYLIQSISFQSDWDDEDDAMTAATDNLKPTTNVTAPTAVDRIHSAQMAPKPKPKIRSSVSRQLFPDVNKTNYGGSNDVTTVVTDADDAMGDEPNFANDSGDDFNSDHIYSNVSKLISDLLQPEKAQTLVQAISEKCQGRLLAMDSSDSGVQQNTTKDVKDTTKNEDMCNTGTSRSPLSNRNTNSANNSSNNNNNNRSGNSDNSGHFGSLWAYNDNSIWRKEQPKSNAHDASAMKPLTSSSSSSSTTIATAPPTAMLASGDQWEHANLEKIWKTDTSSDNAGVDPQSPMAITDTSEPQSTDTTEQTISHSNTLNEKCQPTAINDTCPLAGADHSKLDMNTLEKFWHLIKQANAVHDGPLAPSLAATAPKTAASTRFDRKRRHSATSNHQNYFDHCKLNNCDAFENIKKLATKTITDNYDSGVNLMACDANQKPATAGSGVGTTTIITCKYWTAWDSFCVTSTLAFNNNNNNSNINHNSDDILVDADDSLFNCYHNPMQHTASKYHTNTGLDSLNGNDSILMQPTSTFLKQVAAMVSRPLTR